jgi:prepilin-type N-terminal cleavage/methylation domain-containing protein/prepilin-type processing-associated H-X9-DG protein
MTDGHRRAGAPGFTLIELLVVIAIIVVLIGILIPALRAAREASRCGVCGSNLHQIMLGVFNYAQDNGDYMVPGDNYQSGGTTEASSALPLLKDGGYIPAATAKESGKELNVNTNASCFFCPDGSNNLAPGLPNSKFDQAGAGYTQHSGNTRAANNVAQFYSIWYAINCQDPAAPAPFGTTPFTAVPTTSGGVTVTLVMSAIPRVSQVAFVFDGVCEPVMATNDCRINCRHANYSTCNVAFGDAHVEAVGGAVLPGGTSQSRTGELGSPAQLNTRNAQIIWLIGPAPTYGQ